MNPADLNMLGAGFAQPAQDSQRVFRAALQALSYPGRAVPLAAEAGLPAGCAPAAALMLLALLDADCRVWLSPTLRAGAAAAWLRFHTGCRWAERPADAEFAWIGGGDDLPALAELAWGSDEEPHTSTSCVIEVDSLQCGPANAVHPTASTHRWRLRGPGIARPLDLQVQGLPADFAAQWSANQAAFPRGVDVWLAHDQQLVGLPRSTAIDVLKE